MSTEILQKAGRTASDYFGLSPQDITSLGGYLGQNFCINADGHKYVLKCVPRGAGDKEHLTAQIAAITHAQSKLPQYSLPTHFSTLGGDAFAEADDGLWYLQSFVAGTLIGDGAPADAHLLYTVGQAVGHLDAALNDFYHIGAVRRDMIWDLADATEYQERIDLITDHQLRRWADYFFVIFDTQVTNRLRRLPRQVVHNDCHRFALMTGAERNAVRGIIDFGDMTWTHRICHLAVSISDFITDQVDILSCLESIVGGYHAANPLVPEELEVLYDLVGLRLALYAAHAAFAKKEDPHNAHAQSKLTAVKNNLRNLIAINPLAFAQKARIACGMPVVTFEEKAAKLTEERSKYFSSSLYTHYEDALVLERGAFQYLYGLDGRSYLDCVNNVSQSGHCHPTISRAARDQMSQLNTNSRYVYEPMNKLAERLLATFPAPLDTVFFVNSGSEANDLAMRLARSYTAAHQFIVLDEAYHGNSTASTDISPNRIGRPGGLGLPDYVHRIMLPDCYRNLPDDYRDDPNDVFLKELPALLERLNDDVAAFIAESLVGTGGQFPFPSGYLKRVYDLVRRAGGLTIADEVQVGFGRTGDMWCFEEQNIVPDIVTMGKPMANGHPMGAVVTRREIAEAFDQQVVYFNTFGGNPVSCRTALAVLDVLEKEELRENVRTQSSYLVAGLLDLQAKHEIIGDIRGRGLYIGVELVRDRLSKEPAREIAKACVEKMKSHGILLNTNGFYGNIIKIKPPLIVDRDDIDLLLTYLDAVLRELKNETH